ncbi:tRNA (adenosine(37)-N6)-dimethylallyltransferase MiaA [Lacticaseibacillus paracasei]|jgi:tRNA dimethylallyltransferase|uniref:tRNA dimethylallyltransferase n=4 Tax=Lacticaseibacillus paracasei TaxID=1597 RepID=A0A422M3S0_LACPA|nr:tRNA (adenosine(37)-N6)-dimethylallyltransferase MiaA [Lacticaseibacillus paracasei]EKQ21435.1 tRNA delta(2)-isopentenylpyrophosphate transferase [Lacticaseibacillus casei UW4]EPC30734.1 tRNA delta(2)-isopentenylpyrophosphatetransferase [Lacticaseibacillus paracasei subsp. paracasei Lpp22]AKU34854.1 tRNA delta(2)-isopentenylpyrophosphate transferase [Lacticaseibacillus paracasei]ATG99049.1 tRNA (adenosine(37)-N6)-dimethylallyltransferase MiaA [Lacticaseibacillus paracasei]MBB1166435.1 tRNA 
MDKPPKRIVMIVGPTAVGKSDLGVYLAQQLHGEVINGDAYQIYRHMDIGTAKITPKEMQGVPHHLLDIADPTVAYSVAKFKKAATAMIDTVADRQQLPILVGGTGFYLNSLRLNLPLGGKAPPTAIRQRWQVALATNGQSWLWQQLAQRDPDAAQQIAPANTRRVIRALEVGELTGRRFSDQPQPEPLFSTLVIGLTTDRAVLYDRINARVDAMMQAGLLAEVEQLLKTVSADAQAMQAIGYKELVPYLHGQAELANCVALIKQHSRHFAKRQLTYFRNQMPTHWFDLVAHPEDKNAIVTLVQHWLKQR